jgi:16S rRNA (guanine527-N7)-methyltransferase
MNFDREALRSIVDDGARIMHTPLSSTQAQRLLDYLAILIKWNSVYNLTAVRDPVQMVTQHLLDSLALVPEVSNAKHLLDVGAGGGLPGMVIAIWAAEERPTMRIEMVDTVHKKTAFLTQVKAELGLSNVIVHTARVEKLQTESKFDVITSRAFAELADFVTWSSHLLADNGRFVAMKGVLPENEIAALPSEWRVVHTLPLGVPGLQAQRHLIVIEREKP